MLRSCVAARGWTAGQGTACVRSRRMRHKRRATDKTVSRGFLAFIAVLVVIQILSLYAATRLNQPVPGSAPEPAAELRLPTLPAELDLMRWIPPRVRPIGIVTLSVVDLVVLFLATAWFRQFMSKRLAAEQA